MKLSKYYIYVSTAIICAAVLTVLWWVYGPSQVLKIKNGDSPVHPPTQKADNLVFLSIDYCKIRDTHGTIRRYLISDRVRIPLPIQTDRGGKGCQQTEYPVLIPKDTAPDTYYVYIEVDYQINPLKLVTERITSQNFTIE